MHSLQDIAADEIDTELASEKGSAPRMVVFLGEHADFQEAVIIGDTIKVLTHAKNIEYALLLLIGCYYVAGLEYPKIYSNFLGFVQQFVVGEAFVGDKSSNYTVFIKKYSQLF